MELSQLQYFRVVAKLGNVSRAAQELFVTQPNLSKSIARLEEELGVPLFDHRKGKILLNDYGRCFLSSVNASLEELSAGVQSIQHMYESTQSILALGSSIDDLLPDVLRGFALEHPDIGIRQYACGIHDLAEKLRRHALDLAVTSQPYSDDLLEFRLLGRSRFSVFVGKNNPLWNQHSVRFSDLNGQPLICDRSRISPEALQKLFKEHRVNPRISFEVENTNLIYSLVSSDRGVAFMPMAQMSKLHRDYPNSKIRMIPLEAGNSIPAAMIGILSLRDYKYTVAAKKFVDYLTNWLRDEQAEIETLCGIPPEQQS